VLLGLTVVVKVGNSAAAGCVSERPRPLLATLGYNARNDEIRECAAIGKRNPVLWQPCAASMQYFPLKFTFGSGPRLPRQLQFKTSQVGYRL
jgi:hypothetical protein